MSVLMELTPSHTHGQHHVGVMSVLMELTASHTHGQHHVGDMSVLMELTPSHTHGQHHMAEEMSVLDTRAPSGSWGDPQLRVSSCVVGHRTRCFTTGFVLNGVGSPGFPSSSWKPSPGLPTCYWEHVIKCP
ncbi:unnamed protein product [Gadus morhua 'NCC']